MKKILCKIGDFFETLFAMIHHCEQSEQYHFCGRQKYHAEHGSAYHHLFTTASVIAAK